MTCLVAASLVWAFSFGLIKHKLVRLGLDPGFVAFFRLGVSFLVFVPFLRPRKVTPSRAARLLAVGAVQYGLMYVAYLRSYLYLSAHMVALFTIFTPIYVTLVNDVCTRRFHRAFLVCALVAVGGAAVILWSGGNPAVTLKGFLLLQFSNLCFAVGQVYYRRVLGVRGGRGGDGPAGIRDHEVFAWLYFGGVVVAALPVCCGGAWAEIQVTREQWLTLLYLGVVPSGVCFYLWNAGARRTNAGMLAVMNNAKIPLAVLVALVVFGESIAGSAWRFVIGAGLILAAVLINEAGGRVDSRREPDGRQCGG